MINLDTHILIFALTDQLKPRERALLMNNRWSISSIVYWELAMLAKKGRLNIDLTHRSVSAAIGQIKQWPLDMSIARMSTELDFSGGPADQIIAATSIVNEVPLLTRDKTILRSNRVPFC